MIYFDQSYVQREQQWKAAGIPYIAYSVRTEPQLLSTDCVVDAEEAKSWGVQFEKTNENPSGYVLDDLVEKKAAENLDSRVASVDQSEKDKRGENRRRFDDSLYSLQDVQGATPDFSPIAKKEVVDESEGEEQPKGQWA